MPSPAATILSSNSVGPKTGWLPRHVLVREGGALAGAAPVYLKTDSYGEYIFTVCTG